MVFTSSYGANVSRVVRGSTSMRMRSSTVTLAPMRPSSSIIVVTSLQVRDVADGDRAVGQQRAGEDRQRGVLGAGDAHLAVERHAAADLQLVHADRSAQPAPPAARHSSGVNAWIDSAWISRPMRSPSARVHQLVALQRALARELARVTTTASKCVSSSVRTWTSAPGRPDTDQVL